MTTKLNAKDRRAFEGCKEIFTNAQKSGRAVAWFYDEQADNWPTLKALLETKVIPEFEQHGGRVTRRTFHGFLNPDRQDVGWWIEPKKWMSDKSPEAMEAKALIDAFTVIHPEQTVDGPARGPEVEKGVDSAA